MIRVRFCRLRVPTIVRYVCCPPETVIIVLIRKYRGLSAVSVALLRVCREFRFVSGEKGTIHGVLCLCAPHVVRIIRPALPDSVFRVEEEKVILYCALDKETSQH